MKLLECAGVPRGKFLSDFVNFPYELYTRCPNCIPSLRFLDKENLTRNPALGFHDTAFYMLQDGGRILGRIAVFRDRREEYREHPARFGCLDFTDDAEVSGKLLAAAEEWAVDYGVRELHGPLGFTDFDKTGILVSGFEHDSSFHSSYNFPYYERHLLGHGYMPDVEWQEWMVESPGKMPAALARAARMARERHGLDVLKDKSTKMKRKLVPEVFNLINSSYDGLYGYTKFSAAQISAFDSSLLCLLPRDFMSVVIGADGSALGFALALPSLNSAALKSNGNLLPSGFMHFCKSFFIERDCADLLLVAVRDNPRPNGVLALLVEELLGNLMKQGVKRAHAHWQMSTNRRITNLWKRFDAKCHKTRVCFRKSIDNLGVCNAAGIRPDYLMKIASQFSEQETGAVPTYMRL